VRLLNESLASHPGWTLAAFVLVDVGSALALYAAFAAAAVPVVGLCTLNQVDP
jgi:hypothetical protein